MVYYSLLLSHISCRRVACLYHIHTICLQKLVLSGPPKWFSDFPVSRALIPYKRDIKKFKTSRCEIVKRIGYHTVEEIFHVFIAPSEHKGGWENSRQLRKPKMQSRVCITFQSPQLRLCKHGKKYSYYSCVPFIKYVLKIHANRQVKCSAMMFTYSHLNTPIDQWKCAYCSISVSISYVYASYVSQYGFPFLLGLVKNCWFTSKNFCLAMKMSCLVAENGSKTPWKYLSSFSGPFTGFYM